MPLITRLTRLMRADLNAVLDRLEEPDILLAQALREMDEAIAADERALRELTDARRSVAAHRAGIARRLQSAAAELDVCLAADQDDLARALLRRRLQAMRLDEQLAARDAGLAQRAERLAADLQSRRERLAALKAEADALLPDTQDESGPIPGVPADTLPVTDADVEIALLAEKRGRAT